MRFCLLLYLLLQQHVVEAWIAPIVTKGNKLFASDTGLEFRIKGMAYYPRPNDGEMYDVDNYDWVADEHQDVWLPHLDIMKDLGVNTIRLYSVDPSKSHDKFMCACSERGIYVLVGMAAPCKNCAIQDLEPPACYPDELFIRMQMVYNAFAVYDNTLGFSVGNENNLQRKFVDDGTQTAPCVKALIRDVRNYAASCAQALRQVPIGLDIADIPPRALWIQYFDCAIDNDEFTRAEWIGFNPYVECDPKSHKRYSDSTGLQSLMNEYQEVGYARPIMFGEFGCNLGTNTIDGYENQRSFLDAKWMNEEKDMMDEIVGGNVFEFTTERNHVAGEKLTKKKDAGKYGVGYFSPDDCDHDKIPCVFKPYPEYKNLKLAYTTTKNTTLTLEAYVPKRKKIVSCPSKDKIPTDLQPMPKAVAPLACSIAQPVCKGRKANAPTVKDQHAQKVPLGSKKRPSNGAVGNTTTSDIDALESSSSTLYAAAWMVAMVLVGAGAIA